MSTLKSKILILVLATFIFVGCSTKTENGEFNKDFKEYTQSNFKKTKAKDYVKESIEEVIDRNKTLNLDNTKKLSSLLDDLGEIDDKSYMLSNDTEDIFVRATKNSHKLNINSFEKLNEYLQDTTNQFIYIKKNRFLKNRIKIVALKNKEKIEKSLKRIPFTVEGKMAVSEILEEVRAVSGFNLIAKKNPQAQEEEKTDKTINEKLFSEDSLDELFENTFISFSGQNIMELLDYISVAFNVYVDVDYEKKTIVFEKLKSKIFNITLNNIEYNGSLDVTMSIENDVGNAGSDEKSIKTKIKLEIIESLEENLNAILNSTNIPGKILSFNKTVGSIFVKADKKTMGEIAKQIKIFNDVFNKQIDFKLEVFEFAVSKDFDAGVSLGATINTANFTANLATQTITNSIFDLDTKSSSNNTKSIKGLNINNRTVRLLKQTRHGYILKNSIPYFIDVTDSRSYIKTITTSTTTTDGISVKETTPETSEINEGTVLSVLAKVNGNKIEFNLQPKIVRVNSVDTVTFDENTISLPDLSVNTFSSNVILKNGERKIIGYLTTYEDGKEYDGILPVEDFILGGASSKDYFRKETVFVISADIRE